MSAVGYRVSLEKRDDEVIGQYFDKLVMLFDKYRIYHYARVIVTEEVGYVCSEIVEYANKNEVQILGPFIEKYADLTDTFEVYIYVNDLRRAEIYDFVKNTRWMESKNEFKLDNRYLE